VNQASLGWLFYALLAVAFWGNYGILLHSGQMHMADPVSGRFKAYLFVGLAYFLVAVLAPLAVLIATGANWDFPMKGAGLSLAAGVAGGFGAFFVLLAFGARGTPAVVMSIVFAGAPVINAVVSMILHPPAGGFANLRWQFVVGILFAALGGGLVTLYKPEPAKTAKPPAQQERHQAAESRPPAG